MKIDSLDNLPVGIFEIDFEKNLIDVNDYFCQLSQYSKEQLLGTGWLTKIHPDDLPSFIPALSQSIKTSTQNEFEFRFVCKDGTEVWVLSYVIPSNMPKNATLFVGTITNITELKKSQIELQKLIRFDSLTKLPNRYLFDEILEKSLSRSKRNKMMLALFYLDLDYFKNVNDYYGHTIGDIFLEAVAARLKESVRSEDYIVRLGGDEFAIILEDIHNINTISLSAERIIKNFNKPFIVESHEIKSTMSIGISVFPDEETTAESIVQHADQALYQAKQSGRNCYKYYNKTMQHKLERYMLILKQLQNAIEESQFELYYQPKIDVQTKTLLGIESLLRWNNSFVENGSPSEFITIAEEAGLINVIGNWVITTALSQYKKWYDQFDKMKNVKISVNISAVQLNDSRIIDTVTQTLKENDIPTNNILFELTETAVMKKALDNESMLLTFLMELGIGISIDDFGTGYSSLTYLKQLPIKELKIDKSFIDDIQKNKNGESIIKAIINLAMALDLDVVAEGVETKEQFDFLKSNHCKIIQGYYFSKPLSASEMTAYIQALE